MILRKVSRGKLRAGAFLKTSPTQNENFHFLAALYARNVFNWTTESFHVFGRKIWRTVWIY